MSLPRPTSCGPRNRVLDLHDIVHPISKPPQAWRIAARGARAAVQDFVGLLATARAEAEADKERRGMARALESLIVSATHAPL